MSEEAATEDVSTDNEATPQPLPATPRLRFRWPAVLLVLAAVTASLTFIFWDREGLGSEPGSIVSGSVSNPSAGLGRLEPTEDARWVAPLPYGEVRVSTSVGRELTHHQKEHVLDGTQRWVEVDWTTRDTNVVAGPAIWPGASLEERQEPASRLVLVAGGDRVVLSEELLSSSVGRSVVVAVANADDLHVVVESGTRVQRAEPDSPGLNRDVRAWSNCTSEGTQSATGTVEAKVDCSVQAFRSAYVPGLGWADQGKDWLVIDHASVPQERDDEGQVPVGSWDVGHEQVDYVAAGKPSLELKVDGVGRPRHVAGKATVTEPSATTERRAYLVPSSERAVVTLTYRVSARPGRGQEIPSAAPERATVTAETSLTLEPTVANR